MKIIEKKYNWNGGLTKRNKTNYIVLHHMAGYGSADDIHRIHLNQGWTGIGYHYFIRKDGSIYTGRPIDMVGAHTSDYNSQAVGICFEGNYEADTIMPDIQKKSGQELITYLKGIYPKAQVKKHKDFNATACPGKNFPFDEIKKGVVITLNTTNQELINTNDIVWELNKRGIITNPSLWLKKCIPESNAYWIARKAVNMTKDAVRATKLESVNDIVWELNHRGILTNKTLWLSLLNQDKDLYWLAYKVANMTENR